MPAAGRDGLAQELRHRHARDLLGVLEGEEHPRPGPGVGWPGRDVVAPEQDPALGHLVAGVAGEGVGEGRLARAVGAHEGVQLALCDDEVDAAEDLVAVDLDVQVLDGEHELAAGLDAADAELSRSEVSEDGFDRALAVASGTHPMLDAPSDYHYARRGKYGRPRSERPAALPAPGDPFVEVGALGADGRVEAVTWHHDRLGAKRLEEASLDRVDDGRESPRARWRCCPDRPGTRCRRRAAPGSPR